jgi:hypothetical protein
MPKVVRIYVPMVARASATLPGNEPDAHKGIWFYDPVVFGDIEVGDMIEFESALEVIDFGTVIEVGLNPVDYPKFCSRLNSRGFRWKSNLDDIPKAKLI